MYGKNNKITQNIEGDRKPFFISFFIRYLFGINGIELTVANGN
jgi:hypothetical protein